MTDHAGRAGAPGSSAQRAVLWDMDGTLFDSTNYHWLAWQEVLSAEGYPVTYDRFLQTLGVVSESSVRALVGKELGQVDILRISEIKEARFRALILSSHLELLPGVEYWLSRLHSKGWRQALATSAPRLNVDSILAKLDIGHYFDSIVLAEDVSHSKPHPEVFLLAAQRLGVPRERCIVVEDSPAGIEAARRGGICSIGVSSSNMDLAADCTVSSLDRLPDDAFERLLSSSCHTPCPVL
jgi:HAD superfamily hydrolase (TIGR01509 family)